MSKNKYLEYIKKGFGLKFSQTSSPEQTEYVPESEIADLIKKLVILVSALTDDVIRMKEEIEELKKKVQ